MSILDLILKRLESMTDDEIVKATSYESKNNKRRLKLKKCKSKNVGFNIEVYGESLDYLSSDDKDIFEKMGYIYDGNLTSTNNHTVIHITPTSDTREENGQLNGYCDSLLFDFIICDHEEMLYRKIRNRDGIRFRGDLKNQYFESRIFKDGSTMYIFENGCNIEVFQSVWVNLK